MNILDSCWKRFDRIPNNRTSTYRRELQNLIRNISVKLDEKAYLLDKYLAWLH